VSLEANLGKYAIDDLFQMAVVIEQGGWDLYTRLMDGSDKPQVKNELKFLRSEEESHKAFFVEQLKKRGKAVEGKVSPELHTLLQKEFLGPMERHFAAKSPATHSDTLRFASDLEQRTIDFYTGMKAGRTDAAFMADLDKIIAQEQKHKQKINIILAY
jgi:rubrerythrin